MARQLRLRQLAVSIICVAMGGLALAVANLLTGKWIFIAGLAVGLGIVALVYFGPGQVDWLSDVILFCTLACTSLLAYLLLVNLCAIGISVDACTLGSIRASAFANAFFPALPVIFAWSWVRVSWLSRLLQRRR